MKLKDFLEKALDYDLDKPIVLDKKNGSSANIVDVIECTDGYGEEIVSVKTE